MTHDFCCRPHFPQVAIMPSKYIQDIVIQIIQGHSRDKSLKIVDISASDGAILKRLHEQGYSDLTGTFYGEENEWEYKPAPEEFNIFKVVNNADILGHLPLESESFDIVINTELLEHLENHRHALSELTRLVKPNGLLILETPNIMRLQSRFHFLLTGFHKPRTYFPPYHKPLQEHLYFHVFPVHLPVVDYFLFQYGMERESLRWNRWKLFPIALLLLFFPLMILNLAVFLLRERTLHWPIKKRLLILQLHPAVLICNVLIMVYRKVNRRA